MRVDGRHPNELRPVKIVRGFTESAPGSVLIEFGNTKVLCTASVEESVPEFATGRGWVTASYQMLPGATAPRKKRDSARPDGREEEIRRLIGRALRAVTDLEKLGERTVWVDCTVLEADGSTRTASITGGYVALADAISSLSRTGSVTGWPVRTNVAAVSVGIVDGEILLDLCYEEDARAEVDMNVVMTGEGEFVELQGTAEGKPFTQAALNRLLDLAGQGIRGLLKIQNECLQGD